jgi:hypothetical protein
MNDDDDDDDDYKNIEKIKKDLILISKGINTINHTYDIDINITQEDIKNIDIDYDENKSLIMICTIENPCIILYSNSKSNEIIGFSQNFLIGKSIFAFLHEDDAFRILNSDCQKIITHRVLTNYKDSTGERKYKWFTTKNKKLKNIIIVYLNILDLRNII